MRGAWRTLPRIALFAAFCFAASAFAQFEGELDMKVTMKSGGGTMKISVGKPGFRNDLNTVMKTQDLEPDLAVGRVDRRICPSNRTRAQWGCFDIHRR